MIDVATLTTICLVLLTVIIGVWTDVQDVAAHRLRRTGRRARRYTPPLTLVLLSPRGGTIIAEAIRAYEHFDYPDLRIIAVIPSQFASPAARVICRAGAASSHSVTIVSTHNTTLGDALKPVLRRGLFLILPATSHLEASLPDITLFRSRSLDALALRVIPSTTDTLREGVQLFFGLWQHLARYLRGHYTPVAFQPYIIYRARTLRTTAPLRGRVSPLQSVITSIPPRAPLPEALVFSSVLIVAALIGSALTSTQGAFVAMIAYLGTTFVMTARLVVAAKLPVATGIALCLLGPLLGLGSWILTPVSIVRFLVAQLHRNTPRTKTALP